MNPTLDILLVMLMVATAASYLVFRKIRKLNSKERDWTSGHAEAGCNACPVVKIKQMQNTRTL